MKHPLIKSIVGCGLLLTGITATAQQYSPRAADRYSDRRDATSLLDRVQADLDRASSTAYANTGDQSRVDQARTAVSALQRQMDAGTYDSQTLTTAIVALQRIVDNNTLYNRVRNFVNEDLNQLRDLRDRNNR